MGSKSEKIEFLLFFSFNFYLEGLSKTQWIRKWKWEFSVKSGNLSFPPPHYNLTIEHWWALVEKPHSCTSVYSNLRWSLNQHVQHMLGRIRGAKVVTPSRKSVMWMGYDIAKDSTDLWNWVFQIKVEENQSNWHIHGWKSKSLTLTFITTSCVFVCLKFR